MMRIDLLCVPRLREGVQVAEVESGIAAREAEISP